MTAPKLLGPLAAAAVLLAAFSAARSSNGGLQVSVETKNPSPRPSGGDIQVQATVISSSYMNYVNLVYVTNYGYESSITMSTDGSGLYFATIPASAASPGQMVRWAVTAEDSQGNTVRDPPYDNQTDRQYYGTVVQDTSFSASLPVVELHCEDPKAPFFVRKDKNAALPRCSVLFLDGNFFDNVVVNRKGVSSLNWPKPKFKIDSNGQGKLFEVKPGAKKVKQINFNSEWFEPGENTFMRETLTWEVLRQMGVDYLTSYQTVVRLNGDYFGKFALGVDWTSDALEANGYSISPPSPRFKSESGEYSNLRWDIPSDQVQYYYSQATDGLGSQSGAEVQLVQLGIGIAGGGNMPRSNYMFEWINLPKTINYMASQTLLLNQDRCTKNFEVYLDPSSQQWSMLPWDIEASFGIDRGLGGQPAADYCILACEQWNSPLYCDKNHPQDLSVKTPWGLITTQINPTITAAGGPAGKRKLLQGEGAASNGAAVPGLSLPQNSAIPFDYNEDQTKQGPTITGAPGTFNYLIDAILEIPRTRVMYMRRLRTLMDTFMSTDRLQSMATDEYNKIRDEAKRDNAKWGNPGDPDRGYQQLIQEQIPIRKDQLFNKYSINSNNPLIPDSQPGAPSLSIGNTETGSNGYIQVINGNNYAVDVSGWKLNGGGVSFTFVPGTVIPPKDSMYVAAGSIAAFKSRENSPKGGEGLFVVGPLQGTPDASNGITISP